MVGSAWVVLPVEVLVTLVQFVIAFYTFWLVLRALHGWFADSVHALQELDPLACEFTDPFVQPLGRLTRASPRVASWVWLVLFAVIHTGLDQIPPLV